LLNLYWSSMVLESCIFVANTGKGIVFHVRFVKAIGHQWYWNSKYSDHVNDTGEGIVMPILIMLIILNEVLLCNDTGDGIVFDSYMPAHNDAVRAAVVAAGDGTEALLAGRIPLRARRVRDRQADCQPADAAGLDTSNQALIVRILNLST
jgi:hypothetical protein